MRKLLNGIALVIIVGTIGWAGTLMLSQIHRSAEARKFGYDQMCPIEARGVDGAQYALSVYWNELKRIQGHNDILVRTSRGTGETREQAFSTDRIWLTGVHVRPQAGGDAIVFQMQSLAGKSDITATVGPSGLSDYPSHLHPELPSSTNRQKPPGP